MIKNNQDLTPFNTFGIKANAATFARFTSVAELRTCLQGNEFKDLLVLGGGSNVLFTKDIDALVLRNEIEGFEVQWEDSSYAYVKVGSGMVWHEFVLRCLELNLGGVENLSLIPGSVGASPMQNIGAYGVEIKDVFHSLESYHIATGDIHTFDLEQCEFAYRESVFKRKLKGQYVIVAVTFRLNKHPKINSTYGAIDAELKKMGISEPSIQDISKAVIAIRSSKLPDPKVLGNAGSFFKNPIVDLSIMEKIKMNFPDVPHYPSENSMCKLAAGWLIEQAGWKGFRENTYGVHALQALVLVNYGGSTGQQVYDLSSRIIADVEMKFGVDLEREVNIL